MVLYTISGISYFLIAPLILFLTAFRDKKDFISVLASLLISFFVMTAFLIAFNFLHLLNGLSVLIASIASVFFIGLWIKRNNIDYEKIKLNKNIILFSILIAVFIFILQKTTLHLYYPDSFGKYLPWARFVSELNYIPGVIETGLDHFLLFTPPILYGFAALLMSLFRTTSDNLIASIPILFSSLTIFLLLHWAKESKRRFVAYFAVFSLLSSYIYMTIFQGYLIEPLSIFFLTAAFYFLYRYEKDQKEFYLILLILSLSLGSLTQLSGLLFGLIIFIALLIKYRKNALKIIFYFFLFHIPTLVWLVRNYYYYNNPFYRSLTSLFSGKWNEIHKLWPSTPKELEIGILKFFKDVLIKFPAVIPYLIYSFRTRKQFFTKLTFITLIISVIVISLTLERVLIRYIIPLFAVLALFSAKELALWFEKLFYKIKKYQKSLLNLGVATLIILVLVFANLRLSTPEERFGNQFDLLEFLKQKEQGQLNIWGEDSEVLRWYGDYNLLRPWHNFYLTVNNLETIDYAQESSDYYYDIAKEYKINYIFDSSVLNENTLLAERYDVSNTKNLFKAIEDDPRFELVYNNKERLWKVK